MADSAFKSIFMKDKRIICEQIGDTYSQTQEKQVMFENFVDEADTEYRYKNLDADVRDCCVDYVREKGFNEAIDEFDKKWQKDMIFFGSVLQMNIR